MKIYLKSIYGTINLTRIVLSGRKVEMPEKRCLMNFICWRRILFFRWISCRLHVWIPACTYTKI